MAKSAAGSSSDPVCLDDSDNEDSKPSADSTSSMKRPVSNNYETDDALRSKRNRSSISSGSKVPLYLLKTNQLERRVGALPQHLREHTTSLREMLCLDTPGHASIEWIVISNYMIDFNYLLGEAPELLSVGRALVFYGIDSTQPGAGLSMQQWRQMNSSAVDFVQLNPSAPKNSRSNPLPFEIPFGVHHSKFFLVGFTDGTLRAIIHTANLLDGDDHRKAQGAYIQDFPLKAKGNHGRCEFEGDLVNYLESYRYTTKVIWSGRDATPYTLPEQIRKYDFSGAGAMLIQSVPGWWHVDSKKPKVGHLKLREAVRQHASSSGVTPGHVVCQFSSMGSLTEKYLRDFLSSADASDRPGKNSYAPLDGRLKIVFPTADEVRTSVEGYAGGGSAPADSKNVMKPHLRKLYHRWSSSTATTPWGLGKNVPHIKTFYQYDSEGTGMQWFVLSSHNISTSAWGQLQKNNSKLFVRHWELGVFISPKLLGNESSRLVPLGQEPPGPNEFGLPLPYQLHPEPYAANDEPWAWDKMYETPDRFGGCGLHDPASLMGAAQELGFLDDDTNYFAAAAAPVHQTGGPGRVVGGGLTEPLSADELRRRRLEALAGGTSSA